MAALSRALPLPPPRRASPADTAPRAFQAPARLWLCLYFPALALEALGESGDHPLAVAEGEGTGRRLCACNSAAAGYGIQAGMKPAAARALAPRLEVRARRPGRERAALKQLADWTYAYSAFVALEEAALLLEVQGSLRLFGGFDALLGKVTAGLAARGYSVRTGTAPTPLAARWLALAGEAEPVFDCAALPGRLAGVPIAALDWPEETRRRLARFGITHLGEVLRLPRDGVGRRLGKQWPVQLERALGRLPDPRAAFQPPGRFQSELELPRETRSRETLMPATSHLLSKLERFLVRREAGAQSLILGLHYQGLPPTPVDLHLRRPARRAGDFETLLGYRLESVHLPAPVRAITLRAGLIRPWEAREGSFIGTAPRQASAPGDLIARLQARLGAQAVYRVAAVADHRPERAWRKTAVSVPSPPLAVAPAQPRPLWLYPEPRPAGAGDRPVRCRLLKGPERIVSGWWDGDMIARDYYQARHADGRRLWVFKTLTGASPGWFVHGVFA